MQTVDEQMGKYQ